MNRKTNPIRKHFSPMLDIAKKRVKNTILNFLDCFNIDEYSEKGYKKQQC